jgi:predicted O-methyltransferase YrrM
MLSRICWPDLVPMDTPVSTLERSHGVSGNVADFELDVINRLIVHGQPKTLLEIGTFDGRTTLNLAAHSPADAKVYTLDLPPTAVETTALRIDAGDRLFIDKPVSGERFAGAALAGKITQLYGDSAMFDFSALAGRVDFMFVDGSHSYEYVLRDSITALKLAAAPATILWHDYAPEGPTAWPGVPKALHELQAADPRFKDLKHIAGSTIVILQIPAESSQLAASSADGWPCGDSTQPECLVASLNVHVARATVSSGMPFEIRVQAQNIGRAIWLPSEAPVGPVRLGSRLLDRAGKCLDISFSRTFLPPGRTVQPGESVTFSASISSPPPGEYILEFDFVSEGVVWFTRNGAKAARVEVAVV